MKQRYRLRRQGEFQAAMNGKRFFSGRALVAFAVPGESQTGRVGVTVSRAIRSSVDRNRARRRLREVSRGYLLGADSPLHVVGIRYDVVLVARPAALKVSFAELKAEASQAALKLAALNR
ncbi:MAG TPA: ribonuclease P protein component [Candidatus Dormibacteraeota bacterium]|nr:ribonuclease P protein component [Candidatus Dormibacteraeota bacterium]